MRRPLIAAAILAATMFSTGIATADVGISSPGGFTTKTAVTVDTTAARAWAVLVDPARWWDKQHTYSNDAANLSLEPRANGCFCERLPNKGGVAHGVVVHVDPQHLLRLRAQLGPLEDLAVTGVLSFTLAEAADHRSTTITLEYNVGGFAPDGVASLAKPVDQVLSAQLQRLHDAIQAAK